ncbi:NAD+ kinase family protein [Tieghemostelium lacteum]|uniref:NAD+ kinase family protein n=1 Tax=Tieghemostelium lacteum TaxID=361077 RepID=A0A151ZA83_TIELA|nr:NAD+ kinase family protein [Tieghemostelium lacteum]|eukprot:KYQ90860.1 NAD+ kinase family protein [Tieghemostelium lacteum]
MNGLIETLFNHIQNISAINYFVLLLSTFFFIISYKNKNKTNSSSLKLNNNNNTKSVDSNITNNINNETNIQSSPPYKSLSNKLSESQQQQLQQKLFNKKLNNIKVELENNNRTKESEILSSDEEISSSPLLNSQSFLSPLNFTTGKKKKPHSKKNQSYYVSTYYSSCQPPDQSTLMDDEEDSNSSSPEIHHHHQQTPQSEGLPRSYHKDGLNWISGEGEGRDTPKKSPLTLLESPVTTETETLPLSKTESIILEKTQQHTPQLDAQYDDRSLSGSISLTTSIEDNINIIKDSLPIKNSAYTDPKNPLIHDSKSTKHKKRKCILPQVLELRWKAKPKKILIIKKYNDEHVNELVPSLVEWLEQIGIQVIKESDEISDSITPSSDHSFFISTPSFQSDLSDPYSIDFIISLGGDGTILHTSSLFKTYIPPILSFSLGSLGFLTAFDYQQHREYIQSVIDGKCFVSYRLRLSCTVIFSNGSKKNYQVLNEVCIDRGTNPYLSNLECSCDDKLITIVQADGLIIATSTGSTAYSLSAGGSLVHPTIPAILITPICPHTLSFRPVILPSTSTLAISVPKNSRCSAWASFDGKNRQELKQGDQVIIKTSKWAVPVVSKTNESCEWFEKLADNLNWNVRMVQKSYSITKSTPSH